MLKFCKIFSCENFTIIFLENFIYVVFVNYLCEINDLFLRNCWQIFKKSFSGKFAQLIYAISKYPQNSVRVRVIPSCIFVGRQPGRSAPAWPWRRRCSPSSTCLPSCPVHNRPCNSYKTLSIAMPCMPCYVYLALSIIM